MIGAALLVLLVVVVAWRLSRRRRAGVLAGLDSEKPAFAVAPPRRSVGSRRTETL